MELKEYIKILQKEKKLIVGTVLILLLSVALFSALKPATYDTDLPLLVAKSGAQDTNDYKYGGYYAVQASEAVADNISQWLKSASVVNEIYSRAGIIGSSDPLNKFGVAPRRLRGDSLKALSKFFKADKVSSQYVRLNYRTGDKESAAKIAKAVESVIGEKLESLEKLSNGEISFKIISGGPLVVKSADNIFLNGFLAVVAGLFLGIFLALGKEYFRE
ncbi:hypothetical protein KKG29_01875 [Patescibacteria group bacterium]|nr:hypothetical protein [Patescibacteria group bacterium]MBU3999906.1 hypothetical protein [Patescibacteria group bacterium]MBU4056963.1 hypothetical protein [Patescibacteria group bacterium]MBU4368698.1 hypothetical protein [Patescibacteria group bacterium]